ncbi:retrovirus-related pol polyprotein from transposon TNT 1-94 [Tanacetum coccineum]|uniref:Retrovirus-related pol polyprotein from transposon TNT 1-94 n=1 Tax=Tanacetum coccineum TaxID=301880 RepID=A0ABQ5BFV6_9ASTR
MIIKKDSKIVKGKGERNSLALTAKSEYSDEESSTSGSEDEEYAMAVRDFKKFFKRRGRFMRQHRNDKKTFQRSRDDKNGKVKGSALDVETQIILLENSDSGEEDDEKAKNETCLVAQVSSELFLTYKAYNGGNVIFGSNLCGNITGKGTISNDSLNIDNVEHVDNLRFNLLSVRQICDNKCRVTFSEHDSEITKDSKVIGRGRTNVRLIQSLASKELVRNLPKLKFDQHFCNACKIGKQAHASHKANNAISTTRCLELLHMDLFGPSAIRSYGGNLYTLVIVDDYSRLVAQGYNQQEGIDYDETYALVARLESIRILLAYVCALDFKLFKMDVKSAFLNGLINEEVYVAQPSGFIDFEKPDHVYKLKKALYGLKQAPKAWFDILKAFLIKHEYKMGMVEFRRISLTWFRSCTSRSHYRSISKQTTRYPCEASHGHKIEN